jgi:hypothetical protein
MPDWAKSVSWKGLHPVGELSRHLYGKGISLSKAARKGIEARLQPNRELPEWGILIQPAGAI